MAQLVKIIFTLVFLSVFIRSIPVQAIDLYDSSATEVIGQPDLNSNLSAKKGLWYPDSIAGTNNKLYIAESSGNRISFYNALPTTTYQSFDGVLGQLSVSLNTYPLSTNNMTMSAPRGIYTDGFKFFAADGDNNRVLIWNTLPSTTSTPPDVVLGQPDFSGNTANNGGITASSLNSPSGVWSDGTKLYVADNGNSRVLIWNNIPTSNYIAANVVIGQPNMTTGSANSGGISAHSLKNPRRVSKIGSKLYVSDSGNNRILIFNSVPEANQADANIVLGQSLMTTGTSNLGGISAHSLYSPSGVASDGTNLFISDMYNHRVLIYTTLPTTNQADANYVLGQPDMTHNTANNGGVSAHSLQYPKDTVVIAGKLYVVDYYNNRILIYNSVPTSNQADANLVLGHNSMTRDGWADGGDDVFSQPFHSISGDKLVVADFSNHRVLLWNQVPSSNLPLTPDVIVGQPNLSSISPNSGGASAHTFNYPRAAKICDGKLIVSDYLNSRVLIWNTIPTTNQTDANVVLGQPNMSSISQNTGGISAHSLRMPGDVLCVGSKLVVADLWNHRVLIWNTIPTVNQTDANVVLGQPNMTSNSENNGGLSAHSLKTPQNIASNGTKLVISDTGNARVLIYNTVPTNNQEDANLVLGQPNFSSNTSNYGGLSNKSIAIDNSGAYLDDTRLYVSDSSNNRILGWSTFPTTNFSEADFVIGQPDFTSSTANIGAGRFITPFSISEYNSKLYVTDYSNRRLLVFPFGPQNPSLSVSSTNTRSTTVTLGLSASGAKDMIISEDFGFGGANWTPYSATQTLALSERDGEKNIYVKYRDYANYEGSVLSASTTLDTTSSTGSIRINNDEAATKSRYVTLKIDAQDVTSTVSQMKISEKDNFSDTDWIPYSTTKSFTLSSGDGEKKIYIKFRDAAGNESSNSSDTIELDTVGPGVNLTSYGITKISTEDSDKSSLSSIILSQSVLIKGLTQGGSIVYFSFGDKSYNVTAATDGSFSLTIADLPKDIIKITYYAVDQAGNSSSNKYLTLTVGEEKIQEEVDSTVHNQPTLYSFLIRDSSGKTYPNTKVTINGQEYLSSSEGFVTTEAPLDAEMTILIQVGDKTIKGQVKGDKIEIDSVSIVNKPTINQAKIIPAILILITILAVASIIWRKKFSRANPQ